MMRLKALLFASLLAFPLITAAQNNAAQNNKDKSSDKTPASTADAGSFSIMVSGKHVATETFRMEQRGAENVVSSELKFDDGAVKATQSAELQIGSNGDLKRYAWKETSPSKMEVTVEPQDQSFLVIHVTDDKGTKDNVHPLTPFTSIADTNFFSQIELLMWKFVAMGCRPNAAGMSVCNFKDNKLPVLNPREQQSGLVSVEYIGRQKLKWSGKTADYTAFRVIGEAGDYTVWLDNQSRLIRVLIPGDQTEVLRD